MKIESQDEKIRLLKEWLNQADAVLIGAGSGLSTAAGYTYSGERFQRYFSDFASRYGFHDMYSGGFYPYSSLEEFWGYWCRYIWINRYAPIPTNLYETLFALVKDKDYFVLTTNVDHCFQRSGFDKQRLFYTQGDYGLFQSSHPHGKSAGKTYDNREMIRAMVESEGFMIGKEGELCAPSNTKVRMTVPTELVPYCPDDGEPMTTNLRCDNSFVEDDGWHAAQKRYEEFVERHHDSRVLLLELGVGFNTPVIIKYPFWKYTAENKETRYVCINLGEAYCPKEITEKSMCINGGIGEVLQKLAA